MFKKYWTLLLFFITTIELTYSQEQNLKLKLTSPLLPSPNAASFTKYGDIPVSNSSGIPSISIPVYTIDGGEVSIPISLSYHASGIKVEEIASNVGLGWNLSAGGSVTRQVRGLPDESSQGYNNSRTWVNQFLYGTMTAEGRQDFLSSVRLGQVDTESDLYYYNLPNGASGKFFMDNNGVYLTVPRSNVVINGTINDGWTITDDKGVKYLFQVTDYSVTNTITSSQSGFNDGSEFMGYTAWYINKIVDTKNNEINFKYAVSATGYNSKASEVKKILTSNPIINYSNGSFSVPTEINNLSVTTNSCNANHLQSISWDDGNVIFKYNNTVRQDLNSDTALSFISVYNKKGEQIKKVQLFTSYFGNQPNSTYPSDNTLLYRLRLDSVKEVSTSETSLPPYKFEYSTVTLPDRLSNSQDHWGYFNNMSNSSTMVEYYNKVLGKRKKMGANRDVVPAYTQANSLQKIYYPTGGKTEFVFENNTFHRQHTEGFFTYSNSSLLGMFGDNSSADPDQYYFEFSQNFTISSSLVTYNGNAVLQSVVSGGCDNAQNNLCNITIGVYNTSGQFLANALSDEPIQLSPGNYVLKATIETEFAHTPYASFQINLYPGIYNPPGLYTEYAGGLRIKKIINSIGTVVTNTKEFDYTAFGQNYSSGSIGYNNSYPDYTTIEVQNNYTVQQSGETQIGVIHTDTYESFATTSNLPLLTSGGGYVTYSNVTVKDIDSQSKSNGKSEYTYTSFDDKKDEISTAFPYPPACSYDWKRGLLLVEKIYEKTGENNEGESFRLAQEKYNIYNFLENLGDTTRREITGIKAASQVIWNPQITTTATFNSSLAVAPYKTATEYYWLKKDSLIYYPSVSTAPKIITTTAYNYRVSPLLLISTETVDSKNLVAKKELKYPVDFSTSSPYSLMVARNENNRIVQQIDSKNNIQQQTLQQDYYNWGNNLILPQKIKAKILSGTLEDRILFNQYDSKGNILEQQKIGDTKEVYVWGYNGQYPVAKVTGSSQSTVAGFIDQVKLNNVDGQYNDQQIRDELNKIRIGLAGTNALVTTYTYKPLLGITSETDPNGRTNYYSYDVFGRLQYIKDKDGNIVKRICYNYAGQVTDCYINTAANWQSTGQTRCKPCPSNSNYITNIQQHQEQDINTESSTFNTFRWVDDGVSSNCVITADWQNTGAVSCETSNSQYTGYQLFIQMDMNPCSSTYNTTRTNRVYNPTACPIPVTCNTSNCSGIDKKCINGACQTGVRVNTSSVYMKNAQQVWVWRCTYHYQWTDGSVSPNYTEDNSTSCPLGGGAGEV